MKEIIADIKKRVTEKKDLSEEDIDELVSLFKERGISIMALEKLLNFFQEPHNVGQEVNEEAFVEPSETTGTTNDMLRQENEHLKRELKACIDARTELEKALEHKKKTITWMAIAIVILLIATIATWIYLK